MRERIKIAAEQNNRSMNAEIIGILEEHFPPPKKSDSFYQEIADYLESIPEWDRANKLELMFRHLKWREDEDEEEQKTKLIRKIFGVRKADVPDQE